MSFIFLVDEDMLHNQIIDSELTGGNLTSIDQIVDIEENNEFSSYLMGQKPKLSFANNGNYSIDQLKNSFPVIFYLIFMASYKFVLACMRILKIMMKKNKKSKQKLEKKLKTEKSKLLAALELSTTETGGSDQYNSHQLTNSPTLAPLFKTPEKVIENLNKAEEDIK